MLPFTQTSGKRSSVNLCRVVNNQLKVSMSKSCSTYRRPYLIETRWFGLSWSLTLALTDYVYKIQARQFTDGLPFEVLTYWQLVKSRETTGGVLYDALVSAGLGYIAERFTQDLIGWIKLYGERPFSLLYGIQSIFDSLLNHHVSRCVRLSLLCNLFSKFLSDNGTMINFSVSPASSVLIDFPGQTKKKTILSFCFCQNLGTWRLLLGIPALSRRPSLSLSLSLSHTHTHFPPSVLLSSLHANPHIVWISNTDSNQQKMAPSYENEKLDCMCGYGNSCLFWGLCFFVFARAHRFAHWTRTRNREINHCALIKETPDKESRLKGSFSVQHLFCCLFCSGWLLTDETVYSRSSQNTPTPVSTSVWLCVCMRVNV